MMIPEATIIDYGIGNLLSVSRALEHCGAKVTITDNPEIILSSTRVVLPGVGAFGNGMKELENRGLDKVIKQYASSGKNLIGICLGMQLLFDSSEEFGATRGLSLIPGKVIQIPDKTLNGESLKIPHIGWNGLFGPNENSTQWNEKILATVLPGESAYFVHSFMANPINEEDVKAVCFYGGNKVTALVGKGNIVGCQFHPEKSGEVGIKILKQFLLN